jgi:hypothetical protein
LGGCGLDWIGSGQGPVAGCCECGNEPSGSFATELVSYCLNGSELLQNKRGNVCLHVSSRCKESRRVGSFQNSLLQVPPADKARSYCIV